MLARQLTCVASAAALLAFAACAGGGSGTGSTTMLPAESSSKTGAHTLAINPNSPPPDVPITAQGSVVAVVSNGFALQTGYPHGMIDVETTTSTTITGGTIAVGAPVVVNGTGTFGTFILGSSVQVTGLPPIINVHQGGVWGTTPTLWPSLGDDKNGGMGQTVDGINCGPMVDNSFHVHAFLGILDNGIPLQLPVGLGVDAPGKVVSGFMNSGKCFYNIHTHDAGGTIHSEILATTSNGEVNGNLNSGWMFTLGNVLDMWGETITPTNFGKYVDPVRVFVAQGPYDQGTLTPAGGWTEVTSMTGLEWDAIKIYSHTAIMIEIGPTWVPAANLPQINFYTEF